MNLKLSPKFVMECIESVIAEGIMYGINRAYKHSDREPPTKEQRDIIVETACNAFSEIIVYEGDVPQDAA